MNRFSVSAVLIWKTVPFQTMTTIIIIIIIIHWEFFLHQR